MEKPSNSHDNIKEFVHLDSTSDDEENEQNSQISSQRTTTTPKHDVANQEKNSDVFEMEESEAEKAISSPERPRTGSTLIKHHKLKVKLKSYNNKSPRLSAMIRKANHQRRLKKQKKTAEAKKRLMSSKNVASPVLQRNKVPRNRDDQEILNLSKLIDRNLEDKAEHHHLTPLNVKSILHHLIKNPSVISMLMPPVVNESEMSDLKLTRAKAKELAEKGKLMWPESPIKQPVIKPRTFLDVDYADGEEEDEDYNPAFDKEIDEESDLSEVGSPFPSSSGVRTPNRSLLSTPVLPEETSRDSSLMAPPKTPLVPRISRLKNADQNFASRIRGMKQKEAETADLPSFHTRSKLSLESVPIGDFESQLLDVDPDLKCLTDLDIFEGLNEPYDPDYMSWIQSIAQQDPYMSQEQVRDDEDTNDPDYQFNDEEEDEDWRDDRATKIPRREVQELVTELFQMIPAGDIDSESDGAPETWTTNLNAGAKEARTEDILLLANATSACLLVEENSLPLLKPEERAQLNDQLRKHVQILLQLHFLCKREPQVFREANVTCGMLHELKQYKDSKDSDSAFNIFNLDYALMRQPLELMSSDLDIPTTTKKRSNKQRMKGLRLSVQIELAMSKAILYPSLLPEVSPVFAGSQVIQNCFTPSEDMLLALAMYQFDRRGFAGFLSLIHQYVLPHRDPIRLRSRLQTLRLNSRKDKSGILNPVKFYDEHGYLPPIPVEVDPFDPMDVKIPAEWDNSVKPDWLKALPKRKLKPGQKKFYNERKRKHRSCASSPGRRLEDSTEMRSQSVPSGCVTESFTVRKLLEDAHCIPSSSSGISVAVTADLKLPLKKRRVMSSSTQGFLPNEEPADTGQSGEGEKETEIRMVSIGEEVFDGVHKIEANVSTGNQLVLDLSTAHYSPRKKTATMESRKRIDSESITDLSLKKEEALEAERTPSPEVVPDVCQHRSCKRINKGCLAKRTSPIKIAPRKSPKKRALMCLQQLQIEKRIRPVKPVLPDLSNMKNVGRKSPVKKKKKIGRPPRPDLLRDETFMPGVSAAMLDRTFSGDEVIDGFLTGKRPEGKLGPREPESPEAVTESPRAEEVGKKKKRSKSEVIKAGVESMLSNASAGKIVAGQCHSFIRAVDKGLYMHESKKRKFMNLINESRKNSDAAKMFPKFVELLCSEPQPKPALSRDLTMFLTPADAMALNCYNIQKPLRTAWNAMVKLERYLSAARHRGTGRAFLRSLKEKEIQGATAYEIQMFFRQHFANDKPLLRVLKGLFLTEQCEDEVPEECFETVSNVDSEELDHFEVIRNLPYDFGVQHLSHKSQCPCDCHNQSFDHCNSCRLRFLGGRVCILIRSRLAPAVVTKESTEIYHPLESGQFDVNADQILLKVPSSHFKLSEESLSETTSVTGMIGEEDLDDNSQIQRLLGLVDRIESDQLCATDLSMEGTLGISLDTTDMLKKAVYKAFGSEQAEKSNMSNSSIFLTGQAGKDLMLLGSPTPSAESSLLAPPDARPSASDWTREEDELLLRLLPETITSVESAVELALRSLHSRTGQEIRARYNDILLPLIAEGDDENI